MALVRLSNKQAREGRGRFDKAAFEALTEEDIERFIREDDSDTSMMGEPRYVPRKIDMGALRGRLGLSQEEFARRYYLPLWIVQQWEEGEYEPSNAERVLLFAIDNDPETMANVLRKRRPS